MREATYRAGELIFAEGDYSTDAYIVRRGRVEVYVQRDAERRLAVLHEGAVFGDLALITDQPRVASVRALEDTELLVIDQDGFLALWRRQPDVLLPLLRVIFERVRSIVSLANELALDEHNREVVAAHLGDAEAVVAPGSDRMPRVFLEGLTPAARRALGGSRRVVPHFPFRIGAAVGSDRLFVHNDLVLPDHASASVARNHCMLVNVGRRCFLVDRGSRGSTFVNDAPVGRPGSPSRVELGEGGAEVTIGSRNSPYRFRVVVGGA
jgi:CRP/FNR family cyclic AMP-dependent transcriptional regulator